MHNSLKFITTIIVVTTYHFQLNAQINVAKYEIGIAAAGFIYQGDLTPRQFGSFETIRFGINIHGSKIMSRSFLVRANIAMGGLKGDDGVYDDPPFRKQRNFNFRSSVTEVSLLLVWNPLGTNFSEKGFSPYLFGGPGFSLLNIKRDWSNFNAAYFGDGSDLPDRIATDAAHSLPALTPVIPLGVGVRYGLTQRIAINAETSYRFVFTDYLDGFSQAANPEKKDHFQTVSIGAIYRIGKKNRLDCPAVNY
jgi:Domain of unknown function (DUF6089)